MTWGEYFRTRMPLSSALLNAEAVKKYAFSIRGMVFSRLVIWADSQKLCWMVLDEELEQSYAGLMKNSRGEIQKLCKTMDAALQKQAPFVQTFVEKDISKESMSQLKKLLQKNAELGYVTIGKMFMPIDAFDIFSEKQIKQALREKMGVQSGEKELETLFAQISIPTHVTYAILEEKDTLDAALELKRQKSKKKEIAGKLFEKYWWSELGWDRQEIRTRNFFEKNVQELSSKFSEKELEKKILEISNGRNETAKKRAEMVKKFGLGGLQPVLDLMDQLALYHDVRKEGQMKANWLNFQIIDAISNQTGIGRDLLDQSTFEELLAVCEGKPIDKKSLQERTKAYYYDLNGAKEELLGGSKALQKIALLSKAPEFSGNFGGTIANKGIATGKAKICFGSQDALKKMQKGDILVTGMTTPDFVSAMRIAAAIVTDEGGITCHAAIISRELNIPCIVGTKIGTKVLKDNDLIEVNANHGVVKKL